MGEEAVVHEEENFLRPQFYEQHPFFEPREYPVGEGRYSLQSTHVPQSNWAIHNASDKVNNKLGELEKKLVSYRVKEEDHPLFTVEDFLTHKDLFIPQGFLDLTGKIVERMAQLNAHNLLHELFGAQAIEGDDNDIIANSQDYIHRFDKAPNSVILEKTKIEGKANYTTIAELDGLFWADIGGAPHAFILEAKHCKYKLRGERVIHNIIRPFKQIYPEAHLTYVIANQKENIFHKPDYDVWKRIKKLPMETYRQLASVGVGTVFVSVNEQLEEIEHIAEHLQAQFAAYFKRSMCVKGRTVFEKGLIKIYNGSREPFTVLKQDPEDHLLYREVRGPRSRESSH